jgi:hypothetical protein
LKELTEQMLYKELSDQMESYVLDKTQTFMKSLSGEGVSTILASKLNESFELGSKLEDVLDPNPNKFISNTAKESQKRSHLSRYSLKKQENLKKKRFAQKKFGVLEKKSTSELNSVKNLFTQKSDHLIPKITKNGSLNDKLARKFKSNFL